MHRTAFYCTALLILALVSETVSTVDANTENLEGLFIGGFHRFPGSIFTKNNITNLIICDEYS